MSLMRTVRGWLLSVLLPHAVGYKRRHTEAEAREHVAVVVAVREDRVLAPSLTLSPGVTGKLRHFLSLYVVLWEKEPWIYACQALFEPPDGGPHHMYTSHSIHHKYSVSHGPFVLSIIRTVATVRGCRTVSGGSKRIGLVPTAYAPT